MDISLEITKLIKDTLKKINIEDSNFIVEIPNNKTNGDYSTNVAMELTKKLHKNPKEIAELIVANIEKENIIERIDIAGPGFINFYLNKEYLLSKIEEVISLGDNYGKSTIGNNKKINIEYVSANPTGVLHVGTARGAAYGDALSRIMKFAGYNVTREYYVNDGGNQINNLGMSIRARYENMCGLPLNMPEDGYYGNEIISIAEKIYDEYKEQKLNEDIEYFTSLGVETLLNRIKTDLKDFRVEFDVWSSEKKIRESGLSTDTKSFAASLRVDRYIQE